MNVLNETKIKELESQLSEERERVIQLEHKNTKLFEVEEELEKIRSEKIEYLGKKINIIYLFCDCLLEIFIINLCFRASKSESMFRRSKNYFRKRSIRAK